MSEIIYYQTCFYRDLSTRDPCDQSKYIVLASIDQVIDSKIASGFIKKTELLQVFGDVLKIWDIESKSGIVEYIFSLTDFNLKENRVFQIIE